MKHVLILSQLTKQEIGHCSLQIFKLRSYHFNFIMFSFFFFKLPDDFTLQDNYATVLKINLLLT